MKIKELIKKWRSSTSNTSLSLVFNIFIEELENTDEVKDMKKQELIYDSKELLGRWCTEEAEQMNPEKAKICNDFAVLLEKAINEDNEAEMMAFICIQEEIDGLNYIRMGLGEVKGLPDYLDSVNNGLKPLTVEDVKMQSKWLDRLTSDEALKAMNKKKESEN